MHLYLSVTRESAQPRTWLTPVIAVHAGICRDGQLGVKTYTGDGMWTEFGSDLSRIDKISGGCHAIPTGFEIQMTWAVVVANMYRHGVKIDNVYVQPTNRKWQNANTCELSRMFTQCAYPRDAVFDEKDAFMFMGRDGYLDEDHRMVLFGDLFNAEERDAKIREYMQQIVDMHECYMETFKVEC